LPQVRHAPFVGLHADSFPVPSGRPHPACRCERPDSYRTDSSHMASGHAGLYQTTTIARNNPRQSELWNPLRSAIPQVRLHLVADEVAIPKDAQKCRHWASSAYKHDRSLLTTGIILLYSSVSRDSFTQFGQNGGFFPDMRCPRRLIRASSPPGKIVLFGIFSVKRVARRPIEEGGMSPLGSSRTSRKAGPCVAERTGH